MTRTRQRRSQSKGTRNPKNVWHENRWVQGFLALTGIIAGILLLWGLMPWLRPSAASGTASLSVEPATWAAEEFVDPPLWCLPFSVTSNRADSLSCMSFEVAFYLHPQTSYDGLNNPPIWFEVDIADLFPDSIQNPAPMETADLAIFDPCYRLPVDGVIRTEPSVVCREPGTHDFHRHEELTTVPGCMFHPNEEDSPLLCFPGTERIDTGEEAAPWRIRIEGGEYCYAVPTVSNVRSGMYVCKLDVADWGATTMRFDDGSVFVVGVTAPWALLELAPTVTGIEETADGWTGLYHPGIVGGQGTSPRTTIEITEVWE